MSGRGKYWFFAPPPFFDPGILPDGQSECNYSPTITRLLRVKLPSYVHTLPAVTLIQRPPAVRSHDTLIHRRNISPLMCSPLGWGERWRARHSCNRMKGCSVANEPCVVPINDPASSSGKQNCNNKAEQKGHHRMQGQWFATEFNASQGDI